MSSAPYHPIYRLTVYVAYSVDPNEAQVLHPVAGAVHSNPFVVASAQGISGAQPYLGIPNGRMMSLDPITKKVTVGLMTVTLQDQRTTAGGTNANRWVTAFMGDANGTHQLLHRKVYLEESLDGGSTWSGYFTGRIAGMNLDDPVRVTFSIKGIEASLARPVFVRAPQASVGYACVPNVTPVGLPRAWAALPATAPLTGTFHKSGSVGWVDINFTSEDDLWRAIVLKSTFAPTGEERLVMTVGGQTGTFLVDWFDPPNTIVSGGVRMTVNAPYNTSAMPSRVSATTHWYWQRIARILAQPAGAPGYMALPADGASVTFYAYRDAAASPAMPLFIDNVHPVQLMADIVDGKFSFLDTSGNARPLAGRAQLPGWTSGDPWAPLIADTSIPTVRFCMTKPMKAVDFIEQFLCQPYGLGYRVNGAGQVVALDLRRSSTLSAAGTITDTDLAAPNPRWNVTEDGTYLGAAITVYQDWPAAPDALKHSPDTFPDYPMGGITSDQNTMLVLNPDLTVQENAADNLLKIDAQGQRTMAGAARASTGYRDDPRNLTRLRQVAIEGLAPFAGGVAKLPVVCKRDSAAAAACWPGTWETVRVTTQPDPASNTRGGQRLMLCLSRTDQGPNTNLEFLDGGPGTVAASPTLGTATVDADDPHAVDVPATQNAASDTIVVQYALTDLTVGSAPAATDASWQTGAFVNQWSPSPAIIRNLPTNVRVWIRAKSLPSGRSLELPSPWVALGGTGYVQLATIAAPTGLAMANVFANRGDLSWTVGDATKAVEVYLATGGVPASWTSAMQVYDLAAGSQGPVTITGLAASTQYTVGVRHRDAYGGRSAMTTLTFTSGASVATAPDPYGIDICPVPTSLTPPTITMTIPVVRTGIAIALYGSDPAYQFEIQRAPDSGGAPNTGAAVSVATALGGTTPFYVDALPVDGTTYWYRVRHTGKGDTPSNWTAWVSAKASVIPPDVAPPPVRNALHVQATRGATTGNNIAVSVAVADGQPFGAGYITVAAVASGGASVSPASVVISGAATTSLASTAAAAFTITRGAAPGRVVFTATAANRVPGVDAVDVESLTGGNALPPTAEIDLSTEDDTTCTLSFTGALGTGASGALQWRWRQGYGTAPGTWSAWQSAALPQTEVITRQPKHAITVQLQVQQSDGQVSAIADFPVRGALPFVVANTGHADLGSAAWDNKHLGNVPDDATSNRYAVTANQQTGATRAYGGFDVNSRLSDSKLVTMDVSAGLVGTQNVNPLSSTNLVISIQGHSLQVGGTVISYSSGTVTAPANGTYYVYAPDPTYAGGTVTYYCTTSTNIAGAKGNYLVGKISVTSSSSNTGTAGGNKGLY